MTASFLKSLIEGDINFVSIKGMEALPVNPADNEFIAYSGKNH